MQFGLFNDEPKRKAIKKSVKKEVYDRAKGKCENPKCRKKLPFTGGAGCYHHIRKPSISPTAKTVQLLCRNCHAEHGHKIKTVTCSGFFYNEKETLTKRKRVGSTTKTKSKRKIVPAPSKKKTTKKKTTTKPKPKKRK